MRKRQEMKKFFKKGLVMIMSAALLLGQAGAFLPSEVFFAAESSESDFVIEDGELVDYLGTATDVVIPEGVTEISSAAFYENMTMVSVTIPEGVTVIKNSTFNTCKNLEMVNLPESLETIEANAFYGAGLKYIEIPENVSSIATYAFFSWDTSDAFTIIGTPGSYAERYAMEREYLFNQFYVYFSANYSLEFDEKIVDAFTAIGDMPEGERQTYKVGSWCTEDEVVITEETIIDQNYFLYAKWVAKYPNIADAEISLQKESYDREQYLYTGAPVTPKVWVNSDGVYLEEGVHYTTTYENNIEVGIASVTIQGIGDFSGTVVKNFYIVDKVRDMIRADVEFSKQTFRYDGTAKTPEVTVTFDGVVLEENVDYTLTYSDNTEIGTAHVTITGIGMYTGETTESFWIYEVIEGPIVPDVPVDPEKKDLAGAQIGLYQYEYDYCDSPYFPIVMISFKDEDAYLIENRDYTLTYYNNIEVGTATIVATGIGNYTGYIMTTFEIVDGTQPDNDVQDATVVLDYYDYQYDGTAKCPIPIVTLNDEILVYGVDYTVEYSNNIDAGTAYIYIKGIGDYEGEYREDFFIHYYELAESNIALSQNHFTYDGTAKCPVVTVTALNRTLVEGTDYQVSYSNNVEAGTATVTIQGIRNFGGRIKLQYTISEDAEEVLNGLVLAEDGNWYYYVDGKIATEYTGLVEYYGAWFYVEAGMLNWNYTGLVLYNGIWFYVNGGQLDWGYTGLVQHYGAWFYVEGGQLNWNYTGLVQYYDAWFYVEGGQLNWNYTGLVQYNGIWFYVNGGQLDWGCTGLVEHYGAWFYVEGGRLNWNYTGLVLYNGIWFYVNGGQLDWGYRGLVEHYGAWFYVEGGSLNWNYTGLVEYGGAWFYVNGGQLDWSFTGLCEYNGIWFYIQGGQLNWGYTGTVYFNGIWWYVENGIVVKAV